jgi:hypothetical protein
LVYAACVFFYRITIGFAENGGICAVCGCVGFAVWALPQMGADALLAAFFFFTEGYLF